MTFKLRKCDCENERVTKTFLTSADIDLDGTPTNEQEVLNPSILVNTSTNLQGYNYIEIPFFGRKYFAKIKAVGKDLWQIDCHVDVLNTYASGIRGCTAIIERTNTDANKNMYMNDGFFFTEQRNKVTTHHFKKNGAYAGFDNNNYEYILLMAGAEPTVTE